MTAPRSSPSSPLPRSAGGDAAGRGGLPQPNSTEQHRTGIRLNPSPGRRIRAGCARSRHPASPRRARPPAPFRAQRPRLAQRLPRAQPPPPPTPQSPPPRRAKASPARPGPLSSGGPRRSLNAQSRAASPGKRLKHRSTGLPALSPLRRPLGNSKVPSFLSPRSAGGDVAERQRGVRHARPDTEARSQSFFQTPTAGACPC